jgi:arabinogalactan oligomer/maltooligosaccharide transport system substrate-binding protein
VLLNIDSYLTGRLTKVRQVVIDGMKVSGVMYGVPESAKAVALYYNKALIPTPPATTAELLAMLQSDETLGAGWGSYFLYGLFPAFGGHLMDAAGKCIADKAGYVPAMQYMLQLQTAGAQITRLCGGGCQFCRARMLVNGPWALADKGHSLWSER